MTVGIIIFVLITFAILFMPFAGSVNRRRDYRRQANIALYRRRIKSASPQLAEEMARRLLQDEQDLPLRATKSAVGFSKIFALPFGLSATILALGYYFSSDRIDAVAGGLAQSAAQAEKAEKSTALKKNDEAILRVQDKLRQNPNDGERWFELGRLYMLNNEFDYALSAYANAEGLLGGRADILSAAAGALYYKNKQTVTAQVRMLIDAALEKDPNNTAALSLLASEAFLQADYGKALHLWQQILDSGYTDVDRRAIIQRMHMAETLQKARNNE